MKPIWTFHTLSGLCAIIHTNFSGVRSVTNYGMPPTRHSLWILGITHLKDLFVSCILNDADLHRPKASIGHCHTNSLARFWHWKWHNLFLIRGYRLNARHFILHHMARIRPSHLKCIGSSFLLAGYFAPSPTSLLFLLPPQLIHLRPDGLLFVVVFMLGAT